MGDEKEGTFRYLCRVNNGVQAATSHDAPRRESFPAWQEDTVEGVILMTSVRFDVCPNWSKLPSPAPLRLLQQLTVAAYRFVIPFIKIFETDLPGKKRIPDLDH